jgi:hypothetical protein
VRLEPLGQPVVSVHRSHSPAAPCHGGSAVSGSAPTPSHLEEKAIMQWRTNHEDEP